MVFVDEVDTAQYLVSADGDVIDKSDDQLVDRYISTNGHCYLLLNTINGDKRLYLQENVIAITFLNIPPELYEKPQSKMTKV